MMTKNISILHEFVRSVQNCRKLLGILQRLQFPPLLRCTYSSGASYSFERSASKMKHSLWTVTSIVDFNALCTTLPSVQHKVWSQPNTITIYTIILKSFYHVLKAYFRKLPKSCRKTAHDFRFFLEGKQFFAKIDDLHALNTT